MKRKILFLTGTRADFGKLKPLINAVKDCPEFDHRIFITGIHVMSRYGFTADEIFKSGFKNVYTFMNQIQGEPMEQVVANTIGGLSRFLNEYKPDLLVVHGDRVEALAGSIAGSLRNILVAHIEGGDVSGTIDDLIRHAVSKMSHLHFVTNSKAAARLRQLGESPKSIFIIGSPDIDVMMSENLPGIEFVKEYYGIQFRKFGIALYHPVTTEQALQEKNAAAFVSGLEASGENFIIIYPNNDEGCEHIFSAYAKLAGNTHFKIFPSLRFEYFLVLLKNCLFIAGNSSAGIYEAPVYAIPSINVGNRQENRFRHNSIIDTICTKEDIAKAILQAKTMKNVAPCNFFGNGNSIHNFMEVLKGKDIWDTPNQKRFIDFDTLPPLPEGVS